jgi:23S rRNA (guanosine2251-2'-O)-methyltransferase
MTRRDAQRGESEIVVFGRYPVEEALRSSGAQVLRLAIAKGRSPADRKAFRRLAHDFDVPLDEISREEMDRLTAAPRHDQGMAAVVRLLRLIELDAFLAAATGPAARRPLRVLGLDGVTNSQNVGMVVRSIVGAGLDGMLWPLFGQPWVNGLVVRAASGAIFECPILRCDSIGVGLAALQGAGFTTFGLDAESDASLFSEPPPHRAAFILGGEALGLSADVRGQLDRLVRIPMGGRLESLNVAVAAGLVAFHAAGLLGSAMATSPDASQSVAAPNRK